MKNLKTPDDAIAFLGLDRAGLRAPRESLRWLCRTGKLRFARVGRHIRFREEWLEECVDKHTVPKEAQSETMPLDAKLGDV